MPALTLRGHPDVDLPSQVSIEHVNSPPLLVYVRRESDERYCREADSSKDKGTHPNACIVESEQEYTHDGNVPLYKILQVHALWEQ